MPSQRVLVVEDDPLVGLDLCDTLRAAGYLPIGPAASVDEATPCAAALLDVRLDTGLVTSVAEMLTRSGVSFGFVTGYGVRALPARYRSHPVLVKPCPPTAIIDLVRSLLRGASGRPGT
jgi:DNA-binding response OmpR family regulator